MRYRCVRRVRKTIRPDCWRGESKRTKTVKRKENTRNGPDQQRRSAHVWWWKAGAGGRRYAGWHTHSLAHATAVGARRTTASDDGVRRRRFFVRFPRKLWERGDTVTTAPEPRLRPRLPYVGLAWSMRAHTPPSQPLTRPLMWPGGHPNLCGCRASRLYPYHGSCSCRMHPVTFKDAAGNSCTSASIL